ncbi:MAG: hypothetical protein K2M04_04170 [Muribaculaceae bacterium]|nr:hypothetical protein [Muribaculaceae bacterium]
MKMNGKMMSGLRKGLTGGSVVSCEAGLARCTIHNAECTLGDGGDAIGAESGEIRAESGAWSAESGGMTLKCRNLHRARGRKGVLVPVDDFGRVATGNGRLLLTFEWDGVGEAVLTARGGELQVTVIEEGDTRGETVSVGRLPMGPTAAVAETSREITLMTEAGAYRLIQPRSGGLAGDWELGKIATDYPALRFGVTATTEMRVTVEERVLKGSYGTTTTRMSREDEEALKDDAMKAYCEIDRHSRGLGYAMQPMLMRYRLKDSEGRTLHESGITLVGTEGGFQLAGRQKVTLAGGKRTAGELKATCFLAGIGLGGDEADEATKRRVAVLEIEGSGPIHLPDLTGETATRVTGNEVEYCLPGMAPGAGLTEARGRRGEITEGLAARAGKALRRVATIAYPYMKLSGGGMMTIGGAASQEGTTKQLIERQNKILAETPAEPGEEETMRARCSMPHTFTATAGTRAGNTTLWGNPTAKPYEGYSLTALAAKMSGAKVAATVEVDLTGMNGESGGLVARNEMVAAGDDLTLSPRLSYPDRRATKMRIRVANGTGSGVRSVEVELKPVAGRNEAAYLSIDQKPITLENDATRTYKAGITTATGVKLTGTVVATESGRIEEAKCARDCGAGEVTAIVGSTPSTSSWDFGRDRFYVMAQGGIVSVACSGNGERLTMQELDRRGVKVAEHVTPTSRSDAGVAAIAGGELVTISGVRVKTLGMAPQDATALGWDGADGDFWITRSTGLTQLRPMDEPGSCYERDTPRIDSLLSDGNRILIITPGHDLLDSKVRSIEAKDVEWTVRVGLGDTAHYPRVRGTVGALRRVTAIGLAMVASVIQARFTASSDNGAGGQWMRLLAGAMLSGALRAPFFLPVEASRRRCMTLTIRGHVAGDAEIRGVQVFMR